MIEEKGIENSEMISRQLFDPCEKFGIKTRA